jgi:hypothetical protein
MVFIVPDAAINQTSNGETNPAQLAPVSGTVLQNVSLSVGGYRKYPIQPLSMVANTNTDANISASSLDVGTAYELYRACANEQPFLNDIDFTNVRTTSPLSMCALLHQAMRRSHSHLHVYRSSHCVFRSPVQRRLGT